MCGDCGTRNGSQPTAPARRGSPRIARDCDKLLDWCDAAARPLQPLRRANEHRDIRSLVAPRVRLRRWLPMALPFRGNIIYDIQASARA